MSTIWLNKWTNQFIGKENIILIALKEWSEIVEKLSDDQIEKALDICKRIYDYPPSISEFLKAALDIPDFDVQHLEKQDSTFSRIMYKKVDKYQMIRMSLPDSRRYLKEIYNSLVHEILINF